MSKNYSKITKSPFIATQNMFFGAFGSIFMLCKFQLTSLICNSPITILILIASSLGSILIAMILKPDDHHSTHSFNQTLNFTYNNSEPYNYAKYCGYNNCPFDKLPEISSKRSLFSIYLLRAAMMSLCVLSMIVTILFVDNISIIDDKIEKQKNIPIGKHFNIVKIPI